MSSYQDFSSAGDVCSIPTGCRRARLDAMCYIITKQGWSSNDNEFNHLRSLNWSNNCGAGGVVYNILLVVLFIAYLPTFSSGLARDFARRRLHVYSRARFELIKKYIFDSFSKIRQPQLLYLSSGCVTVKVRSKSVQPFRRLPDADRHKLKNWGFVISAMYSYFNM